MTSYTTNFRSTATTNLIFTLGALFQRNLGRWWGVRALPALYGSYAHDQRHSLRPLRTQNWNVYGSLCLSYYNPRIERHSRTVILCPQNAENINQINNERRPSRASSFATFPPRWYTDKMNLNDLCQSWTLRVSLANRRHYRNARRCAELCVDCSVCRTLLKIHMMNNSEQSFAILNFREPFVTKSLG